MELIGKLGVEQDWDMLATDMYVNPSIYKSWIESHRKLFREKKIGIIKGIYTGCTSSIVMPMHSCDKILEVLKREWISGKNLIPIDNMFVRLSQNKEIKIARSAPFVTSVRRINKRRHNTNSNQCKPSNCIYATNMLSPERRLSVFNTSNDVIQIASELIKLGNIGRGHKTQYRRSNNSRLNGDIRYEQTCKI